MNPKIKLIVDSFGSERVKLDQSISEQTFLKLGGKVSLFFIAFTTQEIVKMISVCKELKVPYVIFGTGSKMIISDKGFDGVAIKNRTKNIKIVSIKGKVSKDGIGVDSAYIEVDSGVSMDSFVQFLSKQGLQSDSFIGITGSIGGNLFLNKSLLEKVEEIKVLNEYLEEESIKSSELSLRKHIILSAIFKIKAK